MSSRRTGRGNRYGLFLIGLVLLLGGGLALARSLGAFNHPVPLLGAASASSPLLSQPETDYVHGAAWFWPVLGVAAALLALICLRWLLTPLRTRPHPRGHPHQRWRHHRRRRGRGRRLPGGAPSPGPAHQ